MLINIYNRRRSKSKKNVCGLLEHVQSVIIATCIVHQVLQVAQVLVSILVPHLLVVLVYTLVPHLVVLVYIPAHQVAQALPVLLLSAIRQVVQVRVVVHHQVSVMKRQVVQVRQASLVHLYAEQTLLVLAMIVYILLHGR
jgi:hypothetical protein